MVIGDVEIRDRLVKKGFGESGWAYFDNKHLENGLVIHNGPFS
jgi:hypothetical protein